MWAYATPFKSCLAIVTIIFLFSKLQAGFIDVRSPKHNMHIILVNYNALVYIITQRIAFPPCKVFSATLLMMAQLILIATNMMHVNS